MRMLFPQAIDDIDPLEVYADVPSNVQRPAVRLNMIVSVDGGTSWGGVSGALGGPADKALFSVLRSLTDVVLVAAGTMRAEHYGPAMIPVPVQDALCTARSGTSASYRSGVAAVSARLVLAVLHICHRAPDRDHRVRRAGRQPCTSG